MPYNSISEILNRPRVKRVLFYCWIAYLIQAGVGMSVGFAVAFVITGVFR